jgi:energy-converting hydrogenase Eha subunit B
MYDDAGCVALVNEAPLVQQVNASGEPPTPTGGTITDGTYFLTAAAVYGADAAVGPTGASYQDMTVLSGGGTTYALVSGVGNDAQFSNGTVATIGTGIAITQTCPSNMVYPYPRYSVAGTTITLFSSGATTTVLTYSKQ